MEIEKLEQFFELYLKKNELKYKYKDKIYTVELDKVHKSRFSQEKLIVTFDIQVSKDKNITLLGIGSYIFDSMHNEFADKQICAILKSTLGMDGLNAANEKVDEIINDSDSYKVDLKEVESIFFTVRVFVSTSKQKKTYLKNMLYCDGKVYFADDIKLGILEEVKGGSVDVNLLKKALDKSEKYLNSSLKKSIVMLEEEHDIELKRLVEIQEDHGQDQYSEIQKKEEDLLYRIKDLEDKMMNARSFDSRQNYSDKIRAAKKRYETFFEKNKSKKQKIQKSFCKERTELNVKGFDITSDILVVLQITHTIYPISINEKKFTFIPLINYFK